MSVDSSVKHKPGPTRFYAKAAVAVAVSSSASTGGRTDVLTIMFGVSDIPDHDFELHSVQSVLQHGANAVDSSSSSSSATLLSEGAARESQFVRGGACNAQLDCVEARAGCSGSAPQHYGAARHDLEEQLDSAAADWTKAALRERAGKMFLRGGGRIWGSNGASQVTGITKGLLITASEVITDLDVQCVEVQEACGNKLDG